MALIAHRFHSIEADGPWTSPPFPPKERRHIVQGVIGGHIMGRPRWAEDLDGNFIYGLDAKGKEIKAAPSTSATGGRRHATKKKSPAQLQREIDEALARSGRQGRGAVAHYNVPMKWSAWSADRDTWNEYPEGSGFLHSLDALGEEGTAVEVTTSSSKEGRHGKITVTGRPGAYKAVGHFAAELDDGTMERVTVNETARSINKLLAAVDRREQELINAMA